MQILNAVSVACALLVGSGVQAQQQINTISENINQIPELSRLSAILSMPEMQPFVRTLATGPFTFFAPSNVAIEASGIDATNWQLWGQYLRYHLVPTYLTAATLVDGAIPATLLESPRLARGGPVGQVLAITRGSSGMFNVGFGLQQAVIVRPDILSTNGVIQIVNRVFVPPVLPSQTFSTSEMFSRWMDIIRRTGLASTMDGLEGVTIFVPSNEALAAIERLNLSTEQMSSIIRYHIVPGVEYSSTMHDNAVFPTLQGESVSINVQGDRIFVNDAEITSVNILTANGVVHRINKVLLPPSLRAALRLE
jgi:uncharacterized surface protein with fasciclin (FAS1) repeats